MIKQFRFVLHKIIAVNKHIRVLVMNINRQLGLTIVVPRDFFNGPSLLHAVADHPHSEASTKEQQEGHRDDQRVIRLDDEILSLVYTVLR